MVLTRMLIRISESGKKVYQDPIDPDSYRSGLSASG